MNMSSRIFPTEIGVQPVQGRGRQDNYKTQRTPQPVIQADYIKTNQEPRPTAVLTAVAVTTHLCMACLVPDKPSMMDYMFNNLQAFILECGRANGIPKRRQGHTQRTTKSHSSKTRIRDSTTLTGLQQQQPRKCRTTTPNTTWPNTHLQGTSRTQLRNHTQRETSLATMDHTTRCVDHQPLRSTLRWLHQLRTTPGTQLRRSNRRIRRSTTVHATTAQESTESRTTHAEMHLVRQGYRTRSDESTHGEETTTGLQIRPRTTEQDNRNPKFTTLLETTGLRPPSQSPRLPQRDAGQQTNAEDDVPQPPPSKQARTTAGPVLPSTRPTTGSSSSQLPDSPMATSPTTRRHPPVPAPPTTTKPRRSNATNEGSKDERRNYCQDDRTRHYRTTITTTTDPHDRSNQTTRRNYNPIAHQRRPRRTTTTNRF